jgi:signal peptidase I
MQPTLMGGRQTSGQLPETGDQIIVNKAAYWFHPPERGDIIIFSTAGLNFLSGSDEIYVKRVVGLPGDTVSIHEPNLLIGGHILDQPPIFKKIASRSGGYVGFTLPQFPSFGPPLNLNSETNSMVLGPDEYAVLGDNSINSVDSRYFGPIKAKSIKGKVAFIFSPFERKGRPE